MTDETFKEASGQFTSRVGVSVARRQFGALLDCIFDAARKNTDDIPVTATDEGMAAYLTGFAEGVELGAHMSMHNPVQSQLLADIIATVAAYGKSVEDEDSDSTPEGAKRYWIEAHSASHEVWDALRLGALGPHGEFEGELREAARQVMHRYPEHFGQADEDEVKPN